ncbi:MAG: YlmH/Sll1252 family protein, partial [Pygmaiobacter sp.]
MKNFIPAQTTQEQIFCKQIREIALKSQKTGNACYIGFLDERQQQLAAAQLSGIAGLQHLFFGGFSAAERKVLCVCEILPSEDSFPICVARASAKIGGSALTHRDYLGALMNLGFDRKCIGDILVTQDGAYLMLMTLHAPLLCDELKTVGRVTVSLQLCDTVPQELTAGQGAEQSLNVASLRLDAVLAAVLHTARGQADEVIRSGK